MSAITAATSVMRPDPSMKPAIPHMIVSVVSAGVSGVNGVWSRDRAQHDSGQQQERLGCEHPRDDTAGADRIRIRGEGGTDEKNAKKSLFGQVSCGTQHTLVLAESGTVYSWGPTSSFQRLRKRKTNT